MSAPVHGEGAADAHALPVLDAAAFRKGGPEDRAAFAAAFGAACRGPGFLLLTGHGLDPALEARVFAAARGFFARPAAEKADLAIARSAHNRGWVAEQVEALDPEAGPDAKEAFNIGLDLAPDHPEVLAGRPFRGPNLWPEDSAFRADCLDWFDACLDLGRLLHRAVALDLGLAENWFDDKFQAPLATLRLLRYPGGGGGLGAGEHTDYGALTLLATDGEPGLEVRARGAEGWIPVPRVPGALVVNIGDCLERWTNGLYASTPHRVRAPARERLSIAFFLDPDPQAEVAALPGTVGPGRPARWPPTTGAAHLAERLDATYAHRRTP